MTDWENIKLGNICEVVRGGSPRPIIDYITDESDGVNWLKIGDVKETDKFFTHANEKIKPSGIPKTREVKAGDLILSNSMSFGRAFITLIDGYIHDGWLRLRCDESRLDKEYLYYFLTSNLAQNQFKAIATGSVVNNLKSDTVKAIKIDLPTLGEQKRIAEVLSMFDDKIKCNEEVNKNLEEQIRIICNAWLNDYVPFGGICPSDWLLTPLSSFAKFISGYSYKGTELQESSVAMATIKNFDRKGGFKLDGYKEIVPSSKLKPEHHAELFDTLVAHTDLTQNAEVIGNAEPILSFSGYEDIIFSMDVVRVLPDKPNISKFLIAAMLKTQQFKTHCLGYVNGTTVLHLSKKALPEYSLMLPEDFTVLHPLDEAVSSMYKQMALNIDEIVQLTNLRDALLPQLMSGELDVSNLDL
ncbi:restriction endonuclease subunit S [Gardnerella swidsinskii]|uniref:restriction endonuclease subunit S n=1 Tax=Gardnerella swidsinskii TaxID=2792979 RepID=UPI0039F0CAC3